MPQQSSVTCISPFFLVFLITTALTMSGCKKEIEKSPSLLYTEETAKLLNDILMDEFRHCDCIVMPADLSLIENAERDMPEMDMRGRIAYRMELTDVSQVNSLIGHTEILLLSDEMITHDLRLIPFTEITWDRLFDRKEAEKVWYERCPESMCYISKPLFNKDYTTAVMDFSFFSTCLYMGPSTFVKRDGTWRYK